MSISTQDRDPPKQKSATVGDQGFPLISLIKDGLSVQLPFNDSVMLIANRRVYEGTIRAIGLLSAIAKNGFKS